jgi:hypothetical protein
MQGTTGRGAAKRPVSVGRAAWRSAMEIYRQQCIQFHPGGHDSSFGLAELPLVRVLKLETITAKPRRSQSA